jgi:hypothetical protein
MKAKLIYIIALLFIGLSSCEISDADDRDLEMQPTLGSTNIQIIQTILGSETEGVDIWVDSENKFPGAKFLDNTDGYINHRFPQGTLIRVVAKGRFPSHGEPDTHLATLFSSDAAGTWLPATHNDPLRGQLKKDGFYTIISSGSFNPDDWSDNDIHSIIVEDDQAAPGAGQARVRYINAVIDVFTQGVTAAQRTAGLFGTIDIIDSDAATILFPAVPVGGTSGYLNIAPGTYNYEVTCNLPRFGGANPGYSGGAATFEAGKTYNVIFYGSIFVDTAIEVVEQQN